MNEKKDCKELVVGESQYEKFVSAVVVKLEEKARRASEKRLLPCALFLLHLREWKRKEDSDSSGKH